MRWIAFALLSYVLIAGDYEHVSWSEAAVVAAALFSLAAIVIVNSIYEDEL